MATYECSLQGLIVGSAEKDTVLQRLVGICGNDSLIDLFQHEIVFAPTGNEEMLPAFFFCVAERLECISANTCGTCT